MYTYVYTYTYCAVQRSAAQHGPAQCNLVQCSIYIYMYISCCSLCVSVGYLLSASVKSEPPQPTLTI